jgi:DUF1680 family protein
MANGQNLLCEKVKITSNFWNRYRKLVAKTVIPYQYNTLNDNIDVKLNKDAFADMRFYDGKIKSHAIENLKIAAGITQGKHSGMNFQDTDVYKWLEAAAYTLKYYPNQDLQKKTDDIVELIGQAQEEDGYLSTIFQINMPKRKFKRLQQSHELYSMGHYIEAGVAYYEATNNGKALEIAKKMADCLDENFGPESGKIHGAGGHPEIELALMRLYETTNEKKYLELTKYFVCERGKDPEFYDKQNIGDGIDNDFWPELKEYGEGYYFADKPVTEQDTAHGHAVRCVYFCVGLAHLARVTRDKELLDASKRLWKDIVKKQMYITGNVGQTQRGEAFTTDYDLPNDTVYGETCASVAMTFFAKQMIADNFNSEYADVIEKEIFNGALSGMSIDGTNYFYVNPLFMNPIESKDGHDKKHILTRRQPWFGTACCPANITRLIASLDQYLYEIKGDTILAHQYIANIAKFSDDIIIEQESNLPWEGEVVFNIENPNKKDFKFALRIPNWSKKNFKIYVDNKAIKPNVTEGVCYLDIKDSSVKVTLVLDMDTHIIRANEKVRQDIDQVAVQRGPIVYCAESADNKDDLWDYKLEEEPQFSFRYEKDLLGGVGKLITNDVKVLKKEEFDDGELYSFDKKNKYHSSQLTLIPYYAWANREEGQMSVWLHE